MAVIEPDRHPLLHDVARGARWLGTDEFPSCREWADEHETWLRFVSDHSELGRYLPRLRGPKERRDEAFAEIAVAFFLATRCGVPVLQWEPLGVNRTEGDLLVGMASFPPVFVEVKSPGWEAEVAMAEGHASPRLQQPKYISGEARATGPWAAVRHAVKKGYPKLPDTTPTLLVIKDDLMVSLLDWGRPVIDIGLYVVKQPGQASGYLAESGPFADNRYERLGAVGLLNVRLVRSPIEYRLALFENPHALPAVRVPSGFAAGYPRHAGPAQAAEA